MTDKTLHSKKTFIYALLDPNTGEVRYIGKSDDPNKRFRRHLGFFEPIPTHKQNWLKALFAKKQEPILKILEEVDAENWKESERKWIKSYRDAGVNLTNTTDGGEGGFTGEKSAKGRENISRVMKERQAKIKEAQREQYKSEMNQRSEVIGWRRNGLLLDPVFEGSDVEAEFDKQGRRIPR